MADAAAAAAAAALPPPPPPAPVVADAPGVAPPAVGPVADAPLVRTPRVVALEAAVEAAGGCVTPDWLKDYGVSSVEEPAPGLPSRVEPDGLRLKGLHL